jgi:CPA2 family monovalent cation:H+ antiporter-2
VALVAGHLLALLAGKLAIVGIFSRLMGSSPGTALRSGLWLCAGGEFGFVHPGPQRRRGLLPGGAAAGAGGHGAVAAAGAADRAFFRPAGVPLRRLGMAAALDAADATRGAVADQDKHAIICGYGRTGQHLARFLEAEGVSFMALDLDPERVREASIAAEAVSYGDSSKKETLLAAGLSRASVVIITFADIDAALRVIHRVRELRPDVPSSPRAGAGRLSKSSTPPAPPRWCRRRSNRA